MGKGDPAGYERWVFLSLSLIIPAEHIAVPGKPYPIFDFFLYYSQTNKLLKVLPNA